jgi:hypothetical protein
MIIWGLLKICYFFFKNQESDLFFGEVFSGRRVEGEFLPGQGIRLSLSPRRRC